MADDNDGLYDANQDEDLDYMYFKEHEDDYAPPRGSGSSRKVLGTVIGFLIVIALSFINPTIGVIGMIILFVALSISAL